MCRSTAPSSADPPPIRRVGSVCAQREHGFGHPVDHAQKRAADALRQRLASFPITHCRDRDTDPPREFGL